MPILNPDLPYFTVTVESTLVVTTNYFVLINSYKQNPRLAHISALGSKDWFGTFTLFGNKFQVQKSKSLSLLYFFWPSAKFFKWPTSAGKGQWPMLRSSSELNQVTIEWVHYWPMSTTFNCGLKPAPIPQSLLIRALFSAFVSGLAFFLTNPNPNLPFKFTKNILIRNEWGIRFLLRRPTSFLFTRPDKIIWILFHLVLCVIMTSLAKYQLLKWNRSF